MTTATSSILDVPAARRVLYIDSAYRLQEVREKKQEQFFEARHSSGYFNRVWAVHPLVDLVGATSRRIEFFRFSSRQLIVEGVGGGLGLPKFFFPIDFLVSQARLLVVLVRIVRRHDISLIVATDPFYSGLLGLFLKKLCGKPLAIGLGGNYDEIYEATGALAMPRLLPSLAAQNMVAKTVLSRSDLVFGNNRNNLDYGMRHGARQRTAIIPISNRVQAIHRSPPTERTGAANVFARLGLPFGVPTLLCVGRLLGLKHSDDALRAMAAVIAEVPHAIGVFAGDGPMLEELKVQSRALGIKGSVYFLGQTNQEDLSRIIPHCITISPLTGIALIECGLGGSPIVAYDRDWQSDFVEDGVSGFVVPFRDCTRMADKAIYLIRNPAVARRFSAAIRVRARDYADVKKLAKLERAAFDDLLRNER